MKTKNEEKKNNPKRIVRSLSDFCLEDIHSNQNDLNNTLETIEKIFNMNHLPENSNNICDQNINDIKIVGGNENVNQNQNCNIKNNYINIKEDQKIMKNKKNSNKLQKKPHKSINKYQVKSNKYSLDNFQNFMTIDNKDNNTIHNEINDLNQKKSNYKIMVNKKNKENKKSNNNINYMTENNKIKIEKKENNFAPIKKIENSVLNPKMFLFENINIFNSLLIMINNVSVINEYFFKEKTNYIINNCQYNNKYCLSIILYYMNKKMWKSIDEIPTDVLSQKYLEFMDCYIKNYCKSSKPLEYCYDKNNLESIIYFIYHTINQELTAEYLKFSNNNNHYIGNDNLSIFLRDFTQKNKSIISDYFIGIYENKEICKNCQKNEFLINKKNKFRYNSFYYINFNLTEISNYLINKKSNYVNNNSINNVSINLNSCFDYTIFRTFKSYNSYCNSCFVYTQKYNYNFIYSLPIILTITLSNSINCNCNFIFEDQLDLKQYVKTDINNSKYLVIAILCQKIYNNKFSIYCVNPNDGLWYHYTDNKVIKKEKMELNDVPLLLLYQKRNTICYEYKSIKREENKIMLNIKFMNSFPEIKIFFKLNQKIKDIIKKIRTIKNLGDSKITLLIDGQKAKDDEILSNIFKNYNTALVLIQ